MARSRFDYSQLGIGLCGHTVHVWPQICDLGGRNPEVICEDCTRDRVGIDGDEALTVWVPLREPEKAKKIAPKRERKPKVLTGMQALLQQEGLL